MATFKQIVITFFTLLLLIMSLSPMLVGAQSEAINDACQDAPSNSPICQDLQSGDDPVSGDGGLFGRVFYVLSIIAGIISVIVLIIGGIQMMTSDGDPQKFNNARNLMIYAIVGIVIVLFAQAIVRVVVYSLID